MINLQNKSRGFLYWIFKPIFKLSLNTSYKIKTIGKQNTPFLNPTLIIANHTNAVIDAVVIAVSLKKGIYFLARGDAFANKFLSMLLWQLHIIPIFRKEECEDNLEKNKNTFKRLFDLFDAKKPIIIFSEGKCIQEKNLRPFRKGTAHILVDYAKQEEDLNKLFIQPIGLSYYKYDQFGEDLIMNYGTPFSLQQIGLEEIDSKESIEKITAYCHQKLADCLVNQPNAELYGIEIIAEELLTNEGKLEFKRNGDVQTLFDFRKSLCTQLVEQEKINPVTFLRFREDIQNLELGLKSYRIDLSNFCTEMTINIWHFILLFLMTPIFLIGCLLNGIPYLITKVIVKKKVKNTVFINTARVVMSTFLFLIFYQLNYLFIKNEFNLSNNFSRILLYFTVMMVSYMSFIGAFIWIKYFNKLYKKYSFFRIPKEEKKILSEQYHICKEWFFEHIKY